MYTCVYIYIYRERDVIHIFIPLGIPSLLWSCLVCCYQRNHCLARNCNHTFTLLDLCVSSLRRGHANLLCIVPIVA